MAAAARLDSIQSGAISEIDSKPNGSNAVKVRGRGMVDMLSAGMAGRRPTRSLGGRVSETESKPNGSSAVKVSGGGVYHRRLDQKTSIDWYGARSDRAFEQARMAEPDLAATRFT